MENYDGLNEKEKLILAIITSKKRSMSAKQISEELKNNYDIKMSRPTISKYLNDLKKKNFIREVKNGTKI
jgi:uncharacterized membrane protein